MAKQFSQRATNQNTEFGFLNLGGWPGHRVRDFMLRMTGISGWNKVRFLIFGLTESIISLNLILF